MPTSGILEALTSLFGKNSSLMEMLGSEGMKNLISGGTALMNGLQAGDMLDFQKNLAKKQDARTDALFNDTMDSRNNQKEAFDKGAELLNF